MSSHPGVDQPFAQEPRTRDRIRAVGENVRKPQRLVEPVGCRHRLNRIEDDLAVADLLRFIEDVGDKSLADAAATGRRTDEESFDFAASISHFAKGDAADRHVIVERQKQCAAWWRVGTRKVAEFLLEVLESEVEAELGLVFAEELADEGDFVGDEGRADDWLH